MTNPKFGRNFAGWRVGMIKLVPAGRHLQTGLSDRHVSACEYAIALAG